MRTLLPETYLKKWDLFQLDKTQLQEIRLRIGKPILLTYKGKEVVWKNRNSEIVLTKMDLEHIFEWLCGYGVYAYQEEMKKGYITIRGGHRVGISGQVATQASGNVIGMKYINGLLIRVSHFISGIGNNLVEALYESGQPLSVLILSPPGCGKTTMLRDLIRLFSNGSTYGVGQNVSVIDEREELSAAYMGIATHDLGARTDLLLGCSKSVGMEMCLRALGPNVVAVDEIYSNEDLESIKRLKGSGCAILATHHATDFAEFSKKHFGKEVLKEEIFERFVVLKKECGQYLVKDIVKSEEVI